MMAVVYYGDILDPEMCRDRYERWKAIIPEEEIIYREGTKEYYRSVSAHMLVCQVLLNKYLIFDPVVIGREESGRPVLISPAGFHLSITHGGKMVACAVSAVTPVGIDVQPIGKIAPRVLENLYTENEREYVGCDPERFTEIWTRKESFVKMTGTGINRDIGRIDTITGENTNGAVFTTKRIGKKYLTLCTADDDEALFEGR